MTIEHDQLTTDEIRALDRAHVLHSWSTQSQIDPFVVAGAEGRHFWGDDGRRILDFASLSSTPTSATSTRASSRRSPRRRTPCARPRRR